MSRAAEYVVGRHDFAAFQAAGGDTATTEREIFSSTWQRSTGALHEEADGLLTYEVTGSGFLRHMVRNIVGTLVDVGLGKRPPEWVGDVLASRRRQEAGRTAPAEGLFLVRVSYDEVRNPSRSAVLADER
jgi:tRNA pseudouridine38-40 synthase